MPRRRTGWFVEVLLDTGQKTASADFEDENVAFELARGLVFRTMVEQVSVIATHTGEAQTWSRHDYYGRGAIPRKAFPPVRFRNEETP